VARYCASCSVCQLRARQLKTGECAAVGCSREVFTSLIFEFYTVFIRFLQLCPIPTYLFPVALSGDRFNLTFQMDYLT
jgi:hypothetical protein